MRTFKLFGYGGIALTGLGLLIRIVLPNMAYDLQLHDTYYVTSYSAIIWPVSIIYIIFCICYYLYPKLCGRLMNSLLGKLHFWLMFIPILLMWVIDFQLLSTPRRFYQFDSYDSFFQVDKLAPYLLLVMIIAQLIFIFNLFYSFWKGDKVLT